MPSTASMITELQRAVSNYSRPLLLDKLNEVITIVYSENMAQTLAVDSATGQPPILETTAGTFAYDLPADCRELAAVAVNTGIGNPNSNYGLPVWGSTHDIIKFNRIYRPIPATSISYNNSLGTSTVTFTDDPGTTTDQYYLIYYKNPPSIDTEDDEIPLPNELHYLLRQAVLAMLNTENYGQTGFDNSIFDAVMKQIRNRMNRGTQARIGRTGVQLQDMNSPAGTWRGYGRRY